MNYDNRFFFFQENVLHFYNKFFLNRNGLSDEKVNIIFIKFYEVFKVNVRQMM